MNTDVANSIVRDTVGRQLHDRRAEAAVESQRAAGYPLSRWYLRPVAGRLAAVLAPTPVRPSHLTFCGLLAAGAAAAALLLLPDAMPFAAALVLLYWFFDRADGQLARRQGTACGWGAWFDGNVDELVDVGLHVAVAALLAARTGASWPWLLLIAFIAGKHLFMYGLAMEESAKTEGSSGIFKEGAMGGLPALAEPSKDKGGQAAHGTPIDRVSRNSRKNQKEEVVSEAPRGTVPFSLRENRDSPLAVLRRLYHLPGNADVRLHLLVAALLTGWLAAELILVAVYYNLRWMARYVLVARRLGGVR